MMIHETLTEHEVPTVQLNTKDELTSEESATVLQTRAHHWTTTNIFSIYARVFSIMLAKWKKTIENAQEAERIRLLDSLIVPSDQNWRYQVYYRLVDLQREIDTGPSTITDTNDETEMKNGVIEDPNWELGQVIEYPLRPKSGSIDATVASLAAIKETSGSMTEACIEPGWRVGDIILAAKVLQGESPSLTYKDEAEMRRVFGLVYDVLRYKEILNQALHDVGFWYRYGKHKKRERTVWLLLYDMQGRKFSRRGDVAIVKLRERAFREAGLEEIEKALLETKTRLAASVSRLRIGGSALTLEQLLPSHLRTVEGVTWGQDGSIASGWVNTIKIPSKAQFVGEMAKLKLRLVIDCDDIELEENQYVFDPLCPKVINLHDKARERLAMSDLVTSHRFVFLERSLCLGAAAIARSVRSRRLCGPVVLTHSIAPRHTAYLAGLLADIEDAGRLLAFGAGDQRIIYEQYLTKLGLTIQQCRVFSERYVSPPALGELERATIVLATPPCSYTGVRDVVDLAVARGGDTNLLESLTNINIELEQPRSLLTEQLTTLKYALTRPNVQFLIYQAHSILPSETVEMANQVVTYANRMAADKYAREHPPKRKPKEPKDSVTNVARSGRSMKRGQASESKKEQSEERQAQDEQDVAAVAAAAAAEEIEAVPDTDLFEIGSPIELYGDQYVKWFNHGCYLAVIKRKEMMQFNSLFMIKVAESKGLFGDPSKQQAEPKEEEQQLQRATSSATQDSHRKLIKRSKIEADRISAPTHSSIIRSSRGRKEETAPRKSSCPRHSRHLILEQRLSSAQVREARRRDARRWWEESAQFLQHAAASGSCKFRLFHTDPWTGKIIYPRHVQDIVFDRDTDDNEKPNLEHFPSTANVYSIGEARQLKIRRRRDENSNWIPSCSTVGETSHIGQDSKIIDLNWRNVEKYRSASVKRSIEDNKDIDVSNYRERPVFDGDTSKNSNSIGTYSNSSTFSFGYGSRTLTNATRPILLDDILQNCNNENLWQYQQGQKISMIPTRQTSRLFHPGGTLKFSRDNNLDKPNSGTNERRNFENIL